MVEIGIFNALALFLVTFYFVKLNIRTIFFGFTHCDGWLREFDLFCSFYNPVEQEVMAGQFHAPNHSGMLNIYICKYEWEYT